VSAEVTAIIVTYNSEDDVGAALAPLRELHDAGKLDCVVVDNRSRDGTAELIRREHPWTKLVESEENLGYGRGLNIGLSLASTPFVLFMNPDLVIGAADVLMLVRFLQAHPDAGVVAPSILEGDGSIQHAGTLPSPLRIIASAAGVAVRPQRPILHGEAAFRTDWLCGAALVARTGLMKELGGFDPRFFLYFEETDLCRRVLARGYELWALGQASAFHVGSASAKKSGQAMFASCIAQHFFQSRFYYLRKFYGWPAAAITEIAEMALLAIRSLLHRARGRPDQTGFKERLAGPFLSLPRPVQRAAVETPARPALAVEEVHAPRRMR